MARFDVNERSRVGSSSQAGTPGRSRLVLNCVVILSCIAATFTPSNVWSQDVEDTFDKVYVLLVSTNPMRPDSNQFTFKETSYPGILAIELVGEDGQALANISRDWRNHIKPIGRPNISAFSLAINDEAVHLGDGFRDKPTAAGVSLRRCRIEGKRAAVFVGWIGAQDATGAADDPLASSEAVAEKLNLALKEGHFRKLHIKSSERTNAD